MKLKSNVAKNRPDLKNALRLYLRSSGIDIEQPFQPSPLVSTPGRGRFGGRTDFWWPDIDRDSYSGPSSPTNESNFLFQRDVHTSPRSRIREDERALICISQGSVDCCFHLLPNDLGCCCPGKGKLCLKCVGKGCLSLGQ